jgi:hypothetical protein
MSLISVLLPEPLTPVTHGERAEREAHVDVAQVVLARAAHHQLAPSGRPAPRLRASGSRGRRAGRPGERALARQHLSSVPSATTSPPWRPAPGPRSTTQSAARMVSSSCSTTSTVLPRSRSCFSVPAAARCRAGAGRSTARPGCRARPPAGCRSAWPGGSAAPRRRRASRRAAQREVLQPHVHQELEPLPHLLQDGAGDLGGEGRGGSVPSRERHPLLHATGPEERQRLATLMSTTSPMRAAAHGDGQTLGRSRLPPQCGTAASSCTPPAARAPRRTWSPRSAASTLASTPSHGSLYEPFVPPARSRNGSSSSRTRAGWRGAPLGSSPQGRVRVEARSASASPG